MIALLIHLVHSFNYKMFQPFLLATKKNLKGLIHLQHISLAIYVYSIALVKGGGIGLQICLSSFTAILVYNSGKDKSKKRASTV